MPRCNCGQDHPADECPEGTITRRIRVLKDRIEDDTTTVRTLEESKLRRRARLALDRQYPNRWKPPKKPP